MQICVFAAQSAVVMGGFQLGTIAMATSKQSHAGSAAEVALMVGKAMIEWIRATFRILFVQQASSTGREISRRGSTVIVRSYDDFMFHVVDIDANGGPELVGEYAIYRNAVIAAELWEFSKQRRNDDLAKSVSDS